MQRLVRFIIPWYLTLSKDSTLRELEKYMTMTKNNFKIGGKVEILIDTNQEIDVGEYTCTKGMVGHIVDIQNNYLMVEFPYHGDVTPILDFNFDEVKLI